MHEEEDILSEKYATFMLSLMSLILIIFRVAGKPLLKFDFELFIFYLPTITSLINLMLRSRKK